MDFAKRTKIMGMIKLGHIVSALVFGVYLQNGYAACNDDYCDNTERGLRRYYPQSCCVDQCTSYCGPKKLEVHSFFEGGVNVVNGWAQVPPVPVPTITPVPSHLRPRFDELDIQSDTYYAVGIDLKYGNTWSFFHYQQLTPSNATTLNNTLTTMGQTIDAGQLFSMQSYYQWMTFGMGIEYILARPCLRFTPIIDANWVNFSYQFSAVTESGFQHLTQDRNGLVCVRLGGQFDYIYADLFSCQLKIMATPPVTALTIYEGRLSIEYHLYEKNNFRIRPYIGLSWLYFDINDKKEIPLHTRYEAAPGIFIGLHFLM